MLVLSRHKSEQIVIADNIVLTIVSINGDKVRIGIEAPKDVTVHRREVFDAIAREANTDKSYRPGDRRSTPQAHPETQPE